MISLKPKTQNLKPDSGFTLVEILITIFLFGLAFTATSFVLTMNNRSAAAIRNNFIASGLAQEGMEVVRNIRDRDWFLGNPFGTSLPDSLSGSAFRVQWNSIQCNSSGLPVGCLPQPLLVLGSNPNLKKNSDTGIFSYDTGADTIFRRTVEISTVTANVEKKIVVTVSWTERGGFIKSLSAEDHLFNWR